MLRMRQICLVAEQLDAVEADLRSVFGLEVCHRDPGVGTFGLHNFLMPVGNGFLEVVAPIRDGTAAGRYLERRGGDGGYMVIHQCDDMTAARARVERLGIRLVLDTAGAESDGIQLHPADLRGAIVELRWNKGGDAPDGPWGPAGPDWARARRTDVITAMTAAEIQTADPQALAARWAAALDRPVGRTDSGDPSIELDDAVLRFVEPADGRPEGLGGLDVRVADRARVIESAQRGGHRVVEDVVNICGVRFRLVD